MVLRRLGGLSLCLMLVACQSHDEASVPAPARTAPVPAATSAVANNTGALSQASYQGFGDMRFGMDEAAFRKAWGGDLVGGAAPGSDCAMYAPKWARTPPELAFMLEHGHFVRYDVRNDKETAPGGGKVGMDKAQVLALYGDKVLESPAKYEAGASTLRLEGSDGGVLIFDIGADGKVTAWRVGVMPQIDYVEGCS
ncbi:lectin [Dyella sp. C11]|uniref:lectin n=1 Tax=Dyella sp. C11 TaxID=2126991 RepID=UPI001E2AD992|nr:lectin [Dyella sp. C11]